MLALGTTVCASKRAAITSNPCPDTRRWQGIGFNSQNVGGVATMRNRAIPAPAFL
jgi:hypothetical protein